MFHFQQFTVADDCCAMKVGTDGVLLGAWANLSPAQICIDVGTGSGLIALMLAQRYPRLRLLGIEIDPSAAQQAVENITQSPFARQIQVVTADYLSFDPLVVGLLNQQIDAIVCNPPFFEETLLAPDTRRARARHTGAGMSFADFVKKSAELLCQDGSLQVVLPTTAQSAFHAHCQRHGLSLVRQMLVQTVARKPPKRVLLHFLKRATVEIVKREHLLLQEDGQASLAYRQLCADFYL